MQTFAQIPSRTLLIAGQPNSGWSGADEGTPGSFETEFAVKITDGGGGGCLLVYTSLDGRFSADSWHANIDDAYREAEEHFGIERAEWSTPT